MVLEISEVGRGYRVSGKLMKNSGRRVADSVEARPYFLQQRIINYIKK